MEQLGHYYLLETLGAGATSIVYKAQDRRRGRTVALKVIRSAQAKPQFERENLLSQSLKHPNISAVERIERLDDGKVLIVLPFHDGKTLDKLLVPIAWEDALEYIRQAATGLAYAHTENLLHCDIKPANLMLVKSQIKILDFGLARLQSDETFFEQIGTLEYMSPEAARGQKLSASSDLWSLGVVFYELLTGTSPFQAASPITTLRHIAEKEPLPVSHLRPDLPQGLDLVLQKLLSKRPEHRYSSAEALLEDLKTLQEGKALRPALSQALPEAHANLSPSSLNLPNKPEILLGREDELALINLYVQDAECRLLTLQGMGGVGKTHLGLWATHQQATFSHSEYQGIHFVSLINVSESGFVAALADALGVEGNATLDAVAKAIGKRRELLLLDNFEHLRSRSFMLEHLLAACPKLTLFVTSRERLALDAEWVIPLRGLSVPAQLPETSQAHHYDALALFAFLALRQNSEFALSNELESVYSICAQLQGHPLGIRLAVALLKERSIQELVQLLSQSFIELQHGSGHHSSLQAVFEQSYRLLNSEQQALLASLSIFEGGFSLEAASKILATSSQNLDALLDRSLLELSITGRYYQHPILHRFSKDIKEATETLQNRYQDYFLAQLRHLRAMLKGSQQNQAFENLEQDFANLQKALLQQPVWDADSAEPFRAFYTHKGRYTEGYEMFSTAKGDYAQVCAAWFALMLGNLEEAEALNESAKSSQDLQTQLISLNTQAGILLRQNKLDKAHNLSLETFKLSEHLDNLPMQAACVSNLAMLEEALGRDDLAQDYYQQSLKLSEQSQNHAQTITNLNNLADFHLVRRNISEARELLEKALLLSEKSRLTRTKPHLQANLGLCLFAQGDYTNAEAAYLEAYQTLAEREEIPIALRVQACLAQTVAAQGNLERAKELLLQILDTDLSVEYDTSVLSAVVRFAEILDREHNPQAKDLAALVYQHPHAEPDDRNLAEKIAQGASTTLTLEEAVAQLLKQEPLAT